MLALKKLRPIAPYAVILCVGLYLYDLALQFKFERVFGRIGPGNWPRMILLLLMATSIYQVLRLLLTGTRPRMESQAAFQPLHDAARAPSFNVSQQNSKRVLIGLLLTLLFITAFQFVGFALASFVYMCALIYIGGYRSVRVTIGVSLTASLTFVYVFMKVVYVALPLGQGPFLALSVKIMKLIGIH